jgi:hypothetical protein
MSRKVHIKLLHSEHAALHKASPDNVVYGSIVGGHRLPYLRVASNLFGLSIVSDNPTVGLAVRLSKAEKLLFSTLDDRLVFFIFVSVWRSVMSRKTTGLFLRPQTCFETFRSYYPWKKIIFRFIKLIPGVTVATITPFEVAPEFKEISHIGLTDIQYWDRTFPEQIATASPDKLTDEIEILSAGRAILTTIGLSGGVSREKSGPVPKSYGMLCGSRAERS